MWDMIVSVPDHCLSFYFAVHNQIISGAICSSNGDLPNRTRVL